VRSDRRTTARWNGTCTLPTCARASCTQLDTAWCTVHTVQATCCTSAAHLPPLQLAAHAPFPPPQYARLRTFRRPQRGLVLLHTGGAPCGAPSSVVLSFPYDPSCFRSCHSGSGIVPRRDRGFREVRSFVGPTRRVRWGSRGGPRQPSTDSPPWAKLGEQDRWKIAREA
jgi:hypothetical protein